MHLWHLAIHPPVPSASNCSPRWDLMKMVGEIAFYSNATRQSQKWEVVWRKVMRDLLFNWIFSFYWCAQHRYFKTKIHKFRLFMSVAFAYSAHACVGFPQLLWALLTDVPWFWIAPRCEWKVCVLGSPTTYPQCISVFCQVTAGMDFWNTAPLIEGTSGWQIMHSWP